MAKVAGIATKKNGSGEVTHVMISLKQHHEKFVPLLKEMGVVEKTQFEKECEQGVPAQEVFAELRNKVTRYWQK